MSRYERIAAALRESILAGRYAPGDRLPRQRDLADIWKTTLPTVRQALNELQKDGLLRVEHGVGTFVADLDRSYDPFAVASFTEILRQRDLEVETRLLSVDSQARSAAASAALGVTEPEGLVALTRVRFVGGLPIVHQSSFAPGRHRTELADYDGTIPLYAFLREHLGLLAGTYHETVTAETTPASVAMVLGVEAGAPILVARRTSATAESQVFLYDEAYLPSERLQLSITRQGALCSVDLSPTLAVIDPAS